LPPVLVEFAVSRQPAATIAAAARSDAASARITR